MTDERDPVLSGAPLLADTARWNEAAELPKHQTSDVLQDDGSVHYFAALKIGPFTLRWREVPIEWVICHPFVFEDRMPFRLRPNPAGGGVGTTSRNVAETFRSSNHGARLSDAVQKPEARLGYSAPTG